MQDFLFSINAVIPLFILTAIGWFLTKLNVWNSEFLKTANSISFNILIPSMLFYNIYTSDFKSVFDAKLLAFVLISVAVIVGIAFILIPVIARDRARQGVIIQALFRGNFALLGLPLCQSLAGDAGAQIASVFLAFLIPAFNILATIVLSVYSNDKVDSPSEIVVKILKNPLIIGCISGLIFSLLKIPLPAVISKPIKDLNSIATPFALELFCGPFYCQSFINNFKCVFMTGITRLIIIPSLAIFIAYILGFRGIHIALLISTFGTPVAVSSTAMTYKMNGDYDLACQLVVFTTIFSAITITLLAFVTRTLGIL